MKPKYIVSCVTFFGARVYLSDGGKGPIGLRKFRWQAERAKAFRFSERKAAEPHAGDGATIEKVRR